AELLEEAKAARHRLLTGTHEEEIRTADGESVKYAAADLDKLNGYIAGLEMQVSPTRRPRSIGIMF
ncbi:MAG: hypothetical protein H5U11_01445, partial [Rhizobium sp.]|nr:hypothetical protein [Rhizobium sp.]